MQLQMKLGDFLIAYLKKLGVTHLFGIPGDLVISISEQKSLLAIPDWHYAEMARLWSGIGVRVKTADTLRAALIQAEAADSFVLIEVILPDDDLSPIARKYIEASARRAQME